MSLFTVPASRRPASRLYWGMLTAITIAAAILRAFHLHHPMRYDEAFTLLNFAGLNQPAAWFNYSTPNNHVLHTLAVRLVTWLGGSWPVVLRLPAFLAGVALVPSSAALAYGLTGRRTPALVAAALVGAWSLLAEYSVNGRGYSMLCLATVWLAVFSVDVCRDASRRRNWAGWVLVAAAGMFTIPIMIYPIMIFTVVLVVQVLVSRADRPAKRAVFVRLARAVLLAALLTLLLYLPVMHVSGIGAIVSNRFIAPRPLAEVLEGLPAAAGQALRHWARDASLPWLALLGVGLLTCVATGIRRRLVFYTLPLLAPALLACAALSQRVVPFPRVWLFLLPVLLVLAACGLFELAGRLLPRRAPWLAGLVLAGLTAAGAGHQAWGLHHREFLISEDERTLVDAEAICRDAAAMRDGHTAVASQAPAWPSLAYYDFLYAPRPFVSYRSRACTRVLIVVGSRQRLEGVLKANPFVAANFGPLALWREYPHARVYIALRRSAVPAKLRMPANSP